MLVVAFFFEFYFDYLDAFFKTSSCSLPFWLRYVDAFPPSWFAIAPFAYAVSRFAPLASARHHVLQPLNEDHQNHQLCYSEYAIRVCDA
eukprot:m.250795 g.250795  ORF g.250795 m.250795 type:complete len:89 (+) comp17180_c0_seq3:87-353(+)